MQGEGEDKIERERKDVIEYSVGKKERGEETTRQCDAMNYRSETGGGTVHYFERGRKAGELKQ